MAKKSNKKLLIIKLIILFVFLAGAGTAFAFFQISKLAKGLPNPQQSGSWQILESTKIYDKTGQVLLYEINNQGKRTLVSLDKIPQHLKQATVAIEDQSFYNHSALDWKGITRAVFVNIFSGRLAQGGSTITQQLARVAFLSPEKTFSRKIKEVLLSYWIEKYYSKDQILELYLNQVSYGAGANGVEAASQTYFGKSVSDLNLNEAAVIASLPQSPSYYSPWGNHKEELLDRKNYGLEQMYKLNFIDEEERGRNQKTAPQFLEQNLSGIKAPHFVMMVRDYLIDKYGEDLVNNGGLKVITTLDWNLQQIAEKVVEEGAQRNNELYKGKNAALAAQDPKTGQILALVGSANYFDKTNEGNFNVAAQGLRQPGSSFKPLVYLAAFKKGLTPDTIVFDAPTEFSTDPSCPIAGINYFAKNDKCFHPQNYDHEFRGPVNLRSALGQSLNIPAVKVLYLAGLTDSIKTAADFGITTLTNPAQYGLSLVLGGGEVKLIDMVGAYSVFSQDGIKHQQAIVLNVKDSRGNDLENYLDKATQVIEPQYPRLINDILSDAEARRPLFQNSFGLTVFDDRQVALKTGTTDDYRDAWTIGYTPTLVAGVWAGNNRQEPMQRNAGSILAALPIWSAFMKEALNNFPVESFNKPEAENNSKPMLNGQYSNNGEVHNILFYVDKNDLLGPQPSSPQNDFQFNNWEIPVQNWIRSQNYSDFIGIRT